MTHDELLARINFNLCTRDGCDSEHYRIEGIHAEWFALREVVELAGRDIKHESYVWLDGYDYAMKQIIQAIERELE